METNAIQSQVSSAVQFISPETFLNDWQGHRSLTRKVIEAFPEDKLFGYSVGGMRSFGVMAVEIMDLSQYGIEGVVTRAWRSAETLDHATEKVAVESKASILQRWDQITQELNEYWPQISPERFQEVEVAFGAYENKNINTIQYVVDNEIHHRAQGYVFLRSLGIEPPAFWDRF